MKKQRKPRGYKLNGQRSLDMCRCCFAFHCDPSSMSKKFRNKVRDRVRRGCCGACGHSPCTCKSSLSMGINQKKLEEFQRKQFLKESGRAERFGQVMVALGIGKKELDDMSWDQRARTISAARELVSSN